MERDEKGTSEEHWHTVPGTARSIFLLSCRTRNRFHPLPAALEGFCAIFR